MDNGDIFWEQKYFLPERLNEIGVEDETWETWGTEGRESLKIVGFLEIWKFREIESVKIFSEEERILL